MCRGWLAACCLLIAACTAPRQPAPVPREIAGILNGATVLAGEVLMSDDVLVPAGSTLTLLAGTTVRIRAAGGTKIDPEYLSSATELLVRGTLVVEGTAAAPVRFVPEIPVAAGEIAWAGILLDGATASRISGALIEQAEQGIAAIAASPDIRGNTIRGCRYGIVAQRGSEARLLDNLIEKGEGGVFCWLGSRPYLKGNRIVGQSEEGVLVDAGSRPWLDRNVISGNGIGLALGPRDLPYDPTAISGNRENVRLLATGAGQ